MKEFNADVVVVGAGPVGLMCGYLSRLSGMKVIVVDKSAEPLQIGRADALNARTLQLLELAGLFNDLYHLGKPCHTSSVWANGRFISRQTKWWDDLEGCFHKHFLMLGQSFVEQLLDSKMREAGGEVRRLSAAEDIVLTEDGCLTTLANGDRIKSPFVIGADGSRSKVRDLFKIPFEIIRPEIIWAVIDAVIDTDFTKVPEIIVFQAETADVAWIPREGEIDRFYVRMDTKEFLIEEALAKINRAMSPHYLRLERLDWFAKFSVKEAVAESFSVADRVFLAGDACHVHSVNGGQGLNTGLADAFNLIWKLNMVMKHRASKALLRSYETERKAVARSVVETSSELVRATKYSAMGSHAEDYVKIVEKRAANITGMGLRYGKQGLNGQRLHDFELVIDGRKTRVYSLLNYSKFTLLIFGEYKNEQKIPDYVQIVPVFDNSVYKGMAILVRPDSYIHACTLLKSLDNPVSWLSEVIDGL